jgi:hypothetical protein
MSSKAKKSKEAPPATEEDGSATTAAAAEKPKYLGGRKLRAAMKAATRKSKLQKVISDRKKANEQPKLQMLRWYQERIRRDCGTADGRTVYTEAEARQIVAEYLQQAVDELAALKQGDRDKLHRPYRAAAKSAAALKQEMAVSRKVAEQTRLFSTSGVAAPDLTNPQVVLDLLEWDQQPRHMQNIRMRAFVKSSAPRDEVADTS